MPTFTTRVGLQMDADTELYDVDVVNANLVKLDSLLGWVMCTSSTRPSTPYQGMGIIETDTLRRLVYFAAAWRDLFEMQAVYGATAGVAGQRWRTTSTIGGNRALDTGKLNDLHISWALDFDGKMQWGPGAGSPADVNLYRQSAGILRSDQTLWGAGGVYGANSRRQDPPVRYRTTSFTTVASTAATTAQIATIAVPDPGYNYFVTIAASQEIQAVAGTQPVLVVRAGTATGEILGSAIGTDGQYRHVVVPPGYGPKSGNYSATTTFYLMLERQYGTGTMQTTAVSRLFEIQVYPA